MSTYILTEFNFDDFVEVRAQEAFEDGEEKGKKIGEETGKRIGEETGKEIGVKIGVETERIKVAKNLLDRNMPIDEIVSITNISKSQVKELLK